MPKPTKDLYQEEYVDMDKRGMSSVKIKTGALGPCMCYLLTFEHKEKPMAYLSHRSYFDDVAGMALPRVIVKVLSDIWKDFKDLAGFESLKPICEREVASRRPSST